jgi:hypothetical protein
VVIEDWYSVDDAQDVSCGNFWLAVVQLDYDAHHSLLTERDEHAATDDRVQVGRDAVAKRHVQGHGQGDVAEFGHGFENKLRRRAHGQVRLVA